MGSNYRLTFHVDIVFCIDATESMDPVLDSVKNNALHFYQDFQQVMEMKRKKVDQLRVRIVVFRDYIADGPRAMLVTNFFNLPEQSEELETSLRSIEAMGGGDDPEDRLISEEERQALFACFERDLSPLEKQVLVYRIEGLSYSEISIRLHITEKSTDNALQRVRIKLRRLFN